MKEEKMKEKVPVVLALNVQLDIKQVALLTFVLAEAQHRRQNIPESLANVEELSMLICQGLGITADSMQAILEAAK
jgi:hypothetical protein